MKLLYQSRTLWVGLVAAALSAGIGCSRQETPVAGPQGAAAQPEAKAPSAPAEPQARPAPSRPAEPITLAAGTPIHVRTTSALSTESHKAGESFVAHLAEPLMAGERVVAAKGARVEGVVSEASAGGRVKGRAEIAVRLQRVEAADGAMLEISTNSVGRQARSTKRDDAVKVGIGSGVGAAIGAIAGGGKGAAIGAAGGAGAGTGVVLATRGAPAVIPSESVLHFKLAAPVTVTAGAAAPRR